MEIKAKLNYLRISPRKTRLVGNLIKGRTVKEAEKTLIFTYKKAASPFLKFLRSATANAKNNFQLDEDNLYVKELKVDQAPTLKRWMPRARGRATRIKKRGSHISIVLASREQLKNQKQKTKDQRLKP